MEHNPFIEKALRDFRARVPSCIELHDAHLDSILEQVGKLPSPEKEARLVELILNAGEAVSAPLPQSEEDQSQRLVPGL